MAELLRKIYFDAKRGLSSQRKLYREAKDEDSSITMKQVKEFLDQQKTDELTKKTKRNRNKELMIVSEPDTYNADLFFIGGDTRYVGVLAFIDINTKVAYLEPIETKNKYDVIHAFENVWKRMQKDENYIFNLTTDNDSTFLSKQFQDMLTKYGIRHFVNEVGDHNTLGVIDSFAKTIRHMMGRYKIHFKQKKWGDYIHDIETNYNNTYNESIRSKPNNVNMNKEMILIRNKTLYNAVVSSKNEQLPKGTVVRVRKVKQMFEKSDNPTYTDDVYKVDSIEGNKYVLKDESGKIKRVAFDKVRKTQTQKFKPTQKDISKGIFEAVKILGERVRKRGRGYVKEYLIKWKNQPSSENTWEYYRNVRLRNPNQKSQLEIDWEKRKPPA
jgi:hypothetical protein